MKQPFDAKEYQKEVARRAPKSPAALQCLKAFFVGGVCFKPLTAFCFGHKMFDETFGTDFETAFAA